MDPGALSLLPQYKAIPVNGTVSFQATGGVQPYEFSIFDGVGSIDVATGQYSAPSSMGNVVVRVRDRVLSENFAFLEVTENPVITPNTRTIAAGNHTVFSVAGGRPPYVWSVVSGLGSVDSVGIYAAPNQAGAATVRVTDSGGRYSEAVVTVQAALSLAPSYPTVARSEHAVFAAAGGVPPYHYAVISGGGSIDANSGDYYSPAVVGLSVVQAEDSLGNVALTIVTISNPLRINPTSAVLIKNSDFDFSAQGGVPPYVYSVSGGGGSIVGASGHYTAPATAGGPHTVTVTDSEGATSTAQVTVNDVLSFVVQNVTVAVGQTYTFEVSGGVGPTYFLSVPPTQGSFSGYTYTAPAVPGIYTVTVQDSQASPNVATATVVVNPALSIDLSENTIAVGNQAQFTASGGVPPYTFVVQAGGAGGSINASTGAFTAGSQTGDTIVVVQDSYKSSASASVTPSAANATIHINPALAINPSSVTVVTGGSQVFTTTGGVGTVSFVVASGAGLVNGSGNYTASQTTGSAKVRAQDQLGNVSDAAVSIVEPVQIVPKTIAIHADQSLVFSAVGGLAPFTYSVIAGSGSLNASTGAFTAPSSASTVTVRVTDALSGTSDATVTVYTDLLIAPLSKVMTISSSSTFTAVGGVPPYTYSLLEGGSGGVINSATGDYTTPAIPGTYHVVVTDTLSATSTAAVTVNAALSIAPTSKTLAVSNGASFVAAGGVPPYTYSVHAGGGSIVDSTGDYTAPASSGSATVRVTDSALSVADASVTITSAIAITPTSKVFTVNDSAFRFSATGGVPPYVYSIHQGVGAVVASGGSAGDFTASSAGSSKVRVTDTLGNSADSVVTVVEALQISPATRALSVNLTYDRFTASGGIPPYTYSVVEGASGGSVVSGTGVYTAPAAVGAGTYTVRVTDSASHTSDATVTLSEALAISPTSQTILKNGTINFSVTGGVPPYSYLVYTGIGSIIAATGAYTAPNAAGTAVVRVADSIGSIASANVTINGALAISPATKVMVVNGSASFSASGGIPPYTFSKVSGDGSITAGGSYTAIGTAGSAVVRVTDSVSATSDASVTINEALVISPSTVSLVVNDVQSFSASGGVPPYTYSVVEGASGGSVNGSGSYTAPATAGTTHVRVTDSDSNTATATVTVNGVLAINPSSKLLYTGDSDFTFTATGGVAPYTYSLVSGSGSISSAGVYQVPGTAGSAVVRVSDTHGGHSDASVTIQTGITISPSSVTLAFGHSQDFTVSGGASPYTLSLTEGSSCGTLDSGGHYVAGSTAGTCHVHVVDSLGWTKDAVVTVASPISISPATPSVEKGGTVNFSGVDGVPPYSYAVQSHTCGGGSGGAVNSSGVYTAPYETCTAVVRVTDAFSYYAETTVTITHTPGTYHLYFTNAGDFVQQDSTNGTTFPGSTVELKAINRTVTHTSDADFNGTNQGTTVTGGSITLP